MSEIKRPGAPRTFGEGFVDAIFLLPPSFGIGTAIRRSKRAKEVKDPAPFWFSNEARLAATAHLFPGGKPRTLLEIFESLDAALHSAEQKAKQGKLSDKQAKEVAQKVANNATSISPVLEDAVEKGLSEQKLKEIVKAVIEERLAGYQTSENRRIAAFTSAEVQRQIQQIAGNDRQVQEKLKRTVRGFRDPERVLRAGLSIARGFLPGAEGVVAVIEAVNDLFGPPAN